MKINSQAMKKKLACKFSRHYFNGLGLVVLLLLFSGKGYSQKLKRTFVKEIEVRAMPTILSNVPSSLLMEMHTFHSVTNNTRDGYIIQGKENTNRLYIRKDYVIETWNKNVVRQEVDITLKTQDQKTTEALMDQLQIELSQNSDGQVAVDCNMNLVKFKMVNGRFKNDDCRIILNGGKKYRIDYLELRTRLFIPKTANLKVHSTLNHTLRLGDLEGDLDLDIQYGEVYGKKIKNLNANLRFCYNVIFDEAETVVASATNSHLKIDKVKRLHLGKHQLAREPYVNEHYKDWLKNNSSMNLYNFGKVQKMLVFDSANDKFKIADVDDLEIRNSIFSNYKILKLKTRMSFKGKNSDINISDVNSNFKNIDIATTMSALKFKISEDSNYDLDISNKNTLDVKLPANAKLIDQRKAKHSFYRIGEGDPRGTINIRCDRCELDFGN